jgi:hypothetical protein
MADGPSPREVAAAWHSERPSPRSPKDLPDALVEPEWGGLRVAASLTGDEAALWHDGAEVAAPAELLGALVDAFRAVGAVVEGHLTTTALRSSQGAMAATPSVERPPILIPRAFRKGIRDDPFVLAREHDARAAEALPQVLESLGRGERHAFVATDLLWLDGEPLADVPLLERKRHLDAILEESFLVRVTPYVRSTAAPILMTWGMLGFSELTYRAANGRYLAGQENPDRVVARPPEGPLGPAKGPVASR